MSGLNRPDNFNGRVCYAAKVIVKGGGHTRGFDNCFENYDGPAVAAALMRRAQYNPKLRENLPKYLHMPTCQEDYEKYKGHNLTEVARQLRAAAMTKRNAEPLT